MSEPVAGAILQPYQVVDQLAAAFFDQYYAPLRWERIPVTSGSCAYVLLNEHRNRVLSLHINMVAQERTIIAVESAALKHTDLQNIIVLFSRWVNRAITDAYHIPLADTLVTDRQIPEPESAVSTLNTIGGPKSGRKSYPEDAWARRELAKPGADREAIFQQWRQRLSATRSVKNQRETFRKTVARTERPEE